MKKGTQIAQITQIGGKAQTMPSNNLPNQTEKKEKPKKFGNLKISSYICSGKKCLLRVRAPFVSASDLLKQILYTLRLG